MNTRKNKTTENAEDLHLVLTKTAREQAHSEQLYVKLSMTDDLTIILIDH